MATIEVICPKCGGIKVIKHGKTAISKQRYQCKDCKNSFILDYTYNAYNARIKEIIIKMTANASGNINENFKKTKLSISNINTEYILAQEKLYEVQI